MNEKNAVKVIFCDGVVLKKTEHGIENTIVNAYQELRPYNIPGNFTFNVVLMISDINLSIDNYIAMVFHAPDASPVFKVENLKMTGDPGNTGNRTAQIAVDCRNVLLKIEGEYKLEVIINSGDPIYETINVVKGGE